MKHLHVDFSKNIASIKPVNGVNNGPLTCNFTQDARTYFKEAAIPFSRLHDTEYPFGSGEFVDVSCLFKNFNDDPDDPQNYNFALTDEYLKAIRECGARIIYRLGATIEHQPVKVHAVPPKDYMKWAKICEHIIRHYNEGWANGFRFDIEYWEIWNEPELDEHQCWTGTTEEYAHFYKVVATYLKKQFPSLKFGGPTCCTIRSDFPEEFLCNITKDGERTPLDFFSWHTYTTDPKDPQEEAFHLKELLDKYGYTETESVFDEWNFVREWHKVTESYTVIPSVKGAAFDAAMMISMQHSPCDIATYYDAQVKFADCWDGLFEPGVIIAHGRAGVVTPRKPYYAFKAFAELARLGTEVESTVEDGNIYACAAAGEGKAVLIANYADMNAASEKIRIAMNGCEKMSVYRVDKKHDLEKTGEIMNNGVLSIAANTAVLLKAE